ncbi:MAG: tRNA 2-thiouridine(34) synthase MnmA [Alphaproteobacteria bacterium]|nr:tRNA 2-thiouridine(34) synthase MnmA [Alphaproteobacteria bacterium]MCB9931057.1 tRNA 2-thiouridine(34) synthase MnmA [Alphaproteobacteria bacterium]
MSLALQDRPRLDLGLGKPPGQGRVVVAMSGGVDSSVAAALVAAAGYETIGITLQLYDHGAAVERKGACCAGQDIRDARNVADAIGIPHYVLDYESRFRQSVIDDFADAYLRGETPIPCVRCNQTVKFRDLLATARDLEADALVTGHYIRRIDGAHGPELHAALDPSRDQSYFLFATTGEQLDFLRFPLGGLPKTETRALAERFGLPVAAKPDSQDICFVPNGSYAQVVEKLRPGAAEPGDIVDRDGQVLGRHKGILHFTIGQRRGLNLGNTDGTGEPLYVLRLDAATRRVVVGPKSALGRRYIRVGEVNWLGDAPLGPEPVACRVKLRSTMAAVAASIRGDGAGGAHVVLEAPEFGVSPGQACVAYAGSRVLGGGWIAGTAEEPPA